MHSIIKTRKNGTFYYNFIKTQRTKYLKLNFRIFISAIKNHGIIPWRIKNFKFVFDIYLLFYALIKLYKV